MDAQLSEPPLQCCYCRRFPQAVATVLTALLSCLIVTRERGSGAAAVDAVASQGLKLLTLRVSFRAYRVYLACNCVELLRDYLHAVKEGKLLQ